jgi:hypothetical protein
VDALFGTAPRRRSWPSPTTRRPSDLLRYKDGDLAWLPLLPGPSRGAVRRLAPQRASGPTLVSGRKAGHQRSTIVLCYRRGRSRCPAPPARPPRILFTTYTKAR